MEADRRNEERTWKQWPLLTSYNEWEEEEFKTNARF